MKGPFFKFPGCRVYCSDALTFLRELPSKSINCGVTSPPYFGLRDYGEPGQLGLEKTTQEYVEKLVAVFHEFKRVLRDDGTLWLNLGDSYASGVSNNGRYSSKSTLSGFTNPHTKGRQLLNATRPRKLSSGLKPKNLIGIPWRVAFALQADGWYLRQDIIWHKPNPMPKSVTDRCTKAHEYIFLLSKSPRYYFDNEAIKEPVASSTKRRLNQDIGSQTGSGRVPFKDNGNMKAVGNAQTRNKRSVWTVSTKPFKEAHFATFPPDLIEPCILAGCLVGGIVVDMFSGARTVALVSLQNGRKFIGADLSATYCELSRTRIQNAFGF